jgi:Cu2+-exporting ATPase
MRHAMEIISMLLTLPVLVYSGFPFIRNTLIGLKSLHFTMDSLITVGAWSAFIYSVYCLFTGGGVYFDTSAMIITLILLGRYIEATAKGKASMTIQMLTELVPKEARKLTGGSAEAVETAQTEQVALSSIKKGDLLLVKPGERIPLDGTVVSGQSEVDESVITGESRAVAKSAGSQVIGGSMNLFGSVVFEAAGTDKETLLSRIIQSVLEAQASKPRIQNMADRIVAWFVPVMILLALGTLAFYLFRGAPLQTALMTAISVVVIACPCSLGLATPLAVLISSTVASSRGILLKNGEVIENVAKLTGLVFDKTGTVTTGKPVLKDTLVMDAALSAEELLKIAASLEKFSEHSAGHAIMEAAKGLDCYPVSGFHAVPGKGIEGTLDDRQIVVGKASFLEERGIAVGEEIRRRVAAFEEEGHTPVYLGWQERLRGVFLVADSVREDAAQAMASLKKLGLKTAIVSGDTVTTTRAIAGLVGVDELVGGALPQEKRELVAQLQKKGGRIMMIGDGINDAPALTEALVGVGMGRGTEIAMESADAILVRNRLEAVPFLVRLSKSTFSIIKQNIFWAFVYNIAAVPLAISGVLHPIVAAGAMSVSSLFVVFNSLRIKRCGHSIS